MVIRGQIIRIIKPLYGRVRRDLAGLQMRIEAPDGNGNWKALYDHHRSTDFLVQTETDLVFVEHSDSAIVVGTGMHPNAAQKRELLAINRFPVEFNQRYQQYTVWELRVGQTVEIIGTKIDNRVLFARTMGATTPGQQLTSIHNLARGHGDYCIHGKISLVAQPVDADPARPLAFLRMAVQVRNEFDEWDNVFDPLPGRLSPFCLEDGTGRVWVQRPAGVTDAEILLTGLKPRNMDHDQTGKYLELLGLDELPAGRRYQNHAWEYRQNDQVTVCGEVNNWRMTTYQPVQFRI